MAAPALSNVDPDKPLKLADVYASYPSADKLAHVDNFYNECGRKAPAFAYLSTVSKMYSDLKVFARDVPGFPGSKRYVVATDAEVLRKMQTEEANFYEVIERDMPVALGLDLDICMVGDNHRQTDAHSKISRS